MVKSASVPAETFIGAYVTGVKAGKANKVIAAEIGMKVATFNVRLSQLRKKAKEAKEKDANFVNPFDSLPARSRATTDTLGMLAAKIKEVDGVTVTEETPAGESVSA